MKIKIDDAKKGESEKYLSFYAKKSSIRMTAAGKRETKRRRKGYPSFCAERGRKGTS